MRNRKYLTTIIAFVALYIIQFIVFPIVKPRYFPNTGATTIVYFGTFFLLLVILECFISKSIKTWIVGGIIYLALVAIYHGEGLYGIGLRGIDLDGAHSRYDFEFAMICVLLFGIYIIVMEIIVKLVSLLARKIFGLKLPTYNEPPVE